MRGTPMAQIPSQSPAFFNRQDNRDSFRIFADRTGGKAFYGNNDIREAIRSAFDDGRYAYTIGFYPDHAKWDGKFREVKLQLKSTAGQLRYRKGYFATPDQSADAQSAQALMQNAAASPIDATNLRMIVSGKRPDPPNGRKLELQVAIDPKQLLLRGAEGANRRCGPAVSSTRRDWRHHCCRATTHWAEYSPSAVRIPGQSGDDFRAARNCQIAVRRNSRGGSRRRIGDRGVDHLRFP